MLVPFYMARYQEWRADNPAATKSELDEAEETLLGTPDAWATSPVGRFLRLSTESADFDDFDELILATDGARLTKERAAEVEKWLSGLRAWEKENSDTRAARKVHDDFTVIRVLV